MKTIFRTLFILVLGVMFTGCLNEKFNDFDAAEKVEFSFVADDDMTRTAYDANYQLRWNDSDKVGIFIGNSTVNAPAGLTRGADGKVVFTASVNAFNAGDLVSGYYPYSEAVTSNTPAVLEIPALQNQNEANVFNGRYNPLMINPVPCTSASAEATSEEFKLQFYQLGAVAEFDIYSDNKSHVGEQVISVTYKADGVAGSFELDLTKGNAAISALKEAGNQVTVNMNKFVVVTQESQERLIYLAMVPGKYNGVLTVNTNRATYTFDAKEVDFTRASVQRFLVNLDYADRSINTTGVYNWTVQTQDLNDMTSASKSVGVPAIQWTMTGSDFTFKDDGHAFRGVRIGSASKKTDMTLTTESYVGTVKAVVVNASVTDYHKAASAEVSVYVNDQEVGKKTLQSKVYADHIAGAVDGQPMDYIFRLAEPVQNAKIQVKMKLLSADSDCGWDEGGMHLKSIQILDKDYQVVEMTAEEKLAKWSTPYMTYNELGKNSEGGSKLWNGVVEFEAEDSNAPFRSHTKGNVATYGNPYVVIDLGEMTSIAAIGCHTGSRAFGTLVKNVEFFIADQPVISPGYSSEWSAIFGSDENAQAYVDLNEKMTAFDKNVKWISLGEAKHFGWYYQMPMFVHVPYSQIGVLPKTRYIKVELKSFGDHNNTRGVLTEVYVNKITGVDNKPL